MSSFVLDCSVAMAWTFEDETNDYAKVVYRKFEFDSVHVPDLFYLEVANALLVAERRERYTTRESRQFMDSLLSLSIRVDSAISKTVIDDIFSLGREYGLSAYDGAYLELAKRGAHALATLDERLRTAANGEGVALV